MLKPLSHWQNLYIPPSQDTKDDPSENYHLCFDCPPFLTHFGHDQSPIGISSTDGFKQSICHRVKQNHCGVLNHPISLWHRPEHFHITHMSTQQKFMTTWCQFYHQYVANDTVHNCMHDLSKSFHHDLLATICLTWETSHIRRTIRPIVTSKVINWCGLLQIDIICWRNPPHLWLVPSTSNCSTSQSIYFCCEILKFSMAIGITYLNKFARCLQIRAQTMLARRVSTSLLIAIGNIGSLPYNKK